LNKRKVWQTSEGTKRQYQVVTLPEIAVSGCNNGCVNCLTAPEAIGAKALHPQSLKGEHVLIAGFEPLLNGKLLPYIRAIQDASAASIGLLTNARMLQAPSNVEKIAGLGVDAVVVKLYGSDNETHDTWVRVEGAFDEAVEGIRNLRAQKIRTYTTFPRLASELAPDPNEIANCLDLAYKLTNTLPLGMPTHDKGWSLESLNQPKEPGGNNRLKILEEHPGNYRYDVIWANDEFGETQNRRWWTDLFPTVHILTGPICNIRCRYCNVSAGESETQHLYTDGYIETLLGHAAEFVLPEADGEPTVDFIGGEPTLHPNLPNLIVKAREFGFSNVTMCTNGLKLMKPGYLSSLIKAGLNGVRFSFHDHRPEMAGWLADHERAGEQYPEVAKLLLSTPEVRTYFYRLIVKPNVEVLPDYLKWLHSNNRTGHPITVQFGLPSPRGRMFANPDLFPPLHEAREALREAFKVADALDMDVTVHHAPGCVYPEDPSRVATNNIHARQFDARTDEYDVLNFEGDTVYAPKCDTCLLKGRCTGVPNHYHSLQDDDPNDWVMPFQDATALTALGISIGDAPRDARAPKE